MLTVLVITVALEVASAAWLWALDIPREARAWRTLVLLRNLTDVRPCIGYWARRSNPTG
jgi:hypothetical protein